MMNHPQNHQGTTAQLASFVQHASACASLTDPVRYAVADCFGCILTGADSEVARRVSNGLAVHGLGAAKVYGTRTTTSPGNASFVNAAAGHAYDLDDCEAPANTHPTVVLLPACLAACRGRKISGMQLLSAYAVGFEVIARIGVSVTMDHYNRGFHSTGTIGTIGAAAAVAKLLNLNVPETIHALSIAATQSSGYTKQFGTNTKPIQAGLAARAGYEAACLASAGATAHPEIIESERGFSGLMGIAGRPIENLAESWAINEYGILLKPWPSCSYIHRLMTAAMSLRPKIIDRLDEVTAIEATIADFHRIILPYDHPVNREQAMFSVPACVAQILVEGELNRRHFESKFWENTLVARLSDCTRIETQPAKNPALSLDPDLPDRLEIHLGSTVVAQSCAHSLGVPQNPMSESMLAAKFSANTGLSSEIFENLLNWPQADDATALFDSIADELCEPLLLETDDRIAAV